MGNNDHIDSQGKRKRIDSLKSEKKSNMNEYEINLPQKIRLLQSWEQGSVPNQDTNFSNENNLGNILSHLENRILKHPHSSEGRDQHSIPAQFLRQAQIIKNYSDFTRTENSDVVKKMFHFKRLLENSLLSVYTKYY
jgi:thiamine kinase-like enzyme